MSRKKTLLIILSMFTILIAAVLLAYFSIETPAEVLDVNYRYNYDPASDTLTLNGSLTNGNRVRQAKVVPDSRVDYENVLYVSIEQAPPFLFFLGKDFSVPVPLLDHCLLFMGNEDDHDLILNEDSLDIYLEEVQGDAMKRNAVIRGRPTELGRIIRLFDQAQETALEALDQPEKELDTYLFLSVPRLESAVPNQDFVYYRSIYIYQKDGGYVMQDGPRDPKRLSDSDVESLLACFAEDYPARTSLEELTGTAWKRVEA